MSNAKDKQVKAYRCPQCRLADKVVYHGNGGKYYCQRCKIPFTLK